MKRMEPYKKEHLAILGKTFDVAIYKHKVIAGQPLYPNLFRELKGKIRVASICHITRYVMHAAFKKNAAYKSLLGSNRHYYYPNRKIKTHV